MQQPLAIIALGANSGNVRQNVTQAIQRLQELSAEPVLKSSLWQTTPIDCPPGSAPFINAVVALVPGDGESPDSLLAKLQSLEIQFGRHRTGVPNEPRPLDLDLIAFGSETRNTTALTLPHPRAHLRRFVLQPLAEILPDFVLPGQSRTAAELLRLLPLDSGMKRLSALIS